LSLTEGLHWQSTNRSATTRARGGEETQLQTKTMGIKTWIKGDTTTGALMGPEKGAGEKREGGSS
jgi:hypothetical protein